MPCPPNCPLRHYPHNYEETPMKPDAGSTCQCDNSHDKLRVTIYREAWRDALGEIAQLREEKKKQHSRIAELEDTVMRLQEASKPSLGRNLGLQAKNEQLEADILDLEKQNEHLLAVLNNVRNVLIRVSGEIESVAQVD
jgi:chromosome segregation ATPase